MLFVIHCLQEVAQMAKVLGFRVPDKIRAYLQIQAANEQTTVSGYLISLILKDMQNGDDGNEESCV